MLISGSAALCLLYYQHISAQSAQDDRYEIIAIVQTCPQNETLKGVYLAELLNLSVDQPTNLFRFKTKEAVRKLLQCPMIKNASVKKIFWYNLC